MDDGFTVMHTIAYQEIRFNAYFFTKPFGLEGLRERSPPQYNYLGSNFDEISLLLAVAHTRSFILPFLATSTPYFIKIRGLKEMFLSISSALG